MENKFDAKYELDFSECTTLGEVYAVIREALNLTNEFGEPTYSPYLFEPYFQQYESWRDTAINYAQKSLNKNQDVVVLMLDFKRFFYQVNISEDELLDYIENYDERNKYLSMKAWSWAGYLFVMIAACATVMLKLAGKEDLMMISSGSVCLVMVLYWISYMVLKKKLELLKNILI